MKQVCENPNCQQGENTVAQELCIACKTAYCSNCSSIHREDNQEHNMWQMRNITFLISSKRISCDQCITIKAEKFCKTCQVSCCESCSTDHKPEGSRIHEIALIFSEPSSAKRNKTKQILKKSYSVSMKTQSSDKLTICGLSFISDGRLVVIDMCNRKLLVYMQNTQQFSVQLIDEPRAMTFVTDNIIAITFGCKMRIRLYQILETNINNLITINLSNLDMKPFSIAYDKSVFAVEVGEGNNGNIIFLDKNVMLAESPNNYNSYLYDEDLSPVEVADGMFDKCIILKQASIRADMPDVIDFAFFTGNTMRIALEVKTTNPFKGCIYISALSKQMVICMDFQGTCKWYEPIPSPRGIHLVKQGYSHNKHLIVASKRNNTIYGLNKVTGCTEVLLDASKIQSPRFISYDCNERLLCSQELESDFSIFSVKP